MTRIRFASNALYGQTLTLTATQGASAQRRQIVNWGHANTGGTVGIVVDRTDGQFAPDRVRFTVDLSQATFDTTDTYDPVADKTYTNGYSPAVHGLVYLWDTGDDGVWTAPQKTLTAWKSKRTAKGPLVQHVYRDAGTYTVRVTVLEPSTGKVATTTASITVKPQAAHFPGTQTICINPVGDDDFSEAPAGARHVNLDTFGDEVSVWGTYGLGQSDPYRWLFKSGCEFDFNQFRIRGWSSPEFTLSGYGTGAPPIFHIKEDTFVLIDSNSTKKDFRFHGFELRGDFDPTTTLISEAVEGRTGFKTTGSSSLDLIITDVKVRGLSWSVISLNTNSDRTRDFRYAFDRLDISDCGGRYNIIIGTSNAPESTVSLTGSLIAQNPNSLSDPNIAACLRVNGAKFNYVAGNDLFNLTETNTVIKVCEANDFSTQGTIDPQLANIHSNAVEGTTAFIDVSPGMNDREAFVQNALIHANIVCGGRNTQTFFRLCAVGVTIRDNICWLPNLPALNGIDLRGWVFFRLETSATGSQTIPDAPVRLDRNTLVNDRNSANNNDTATAFFNDHDGQFLLAGVESAADNLTHYPNLDVAQTPYAPLSTEIIFVPRNTVGRILAEDRPNPTPDTSTITPGPMYTFRPETGSSAIGAATDAAVGTLDFSGTIREAPTDIGAWHKKPT